MLVEINSKPQNLNIFSDKFTIFKQWWWGQMFLHSRMDGRGWVHVCRKCVKEVLSQPFRDQFLVIALAWLEEVSQPEVAVLDVECFEDNTGV